MSKKPKSPKINPQLQGNNSEVAESQLQQQAQSQEANIYAQNQFKY